MRIDGDESLSFGIETKQTDAVEQFVIKAGTSPNHTPGG
jgi:hypothetical protein